MWLCLSALPPAGKILPITVQIGRIFKKKIFLRLSLKKKKKNVFLDNPHEEKKKKKRLLL